MNSRTIFLLAALIGGAVFPIQVALNSLLTGYVGQPMQVTFISFSVGSIVSLAICLVARYPLPEITSLAQSSWWMWIGGGLGALYVWSTIFAAPKIGVGAVLGFTIAGQMIAGIVLDHFGLLGLTRHAATPLRIAGTVLVVLGVSMIAAQK